MGDYLQARSIVGQTAGTVGYSIRADVNGDGDINMGDAMTIRGAVGTVLPAGNPTVPLSPAAVSGLARAFEAFFAAELQGKQAANASTVAAPVVSANILGGYLIAALPNPLGRFMTLGALSERLRWDTHEPVYIGPTELTGSDPGATLAVALFCYHRRPPRFGSIKPVVWFWKSG